MSTKGLKTNNVGWEVDLSSMFEGTVAGLPDENDPLRQPTFTLAVGEAARPTPEHLQTLKEGRDFKIFIRHEAEHVYWFIDSEGKEGRFTSPCLEFWTSQWEKAS